MTIIFLTIAIINSINYYAKHSSAFNNVNTHLSELVLLLIKYIYYMNGYFVNKCFPVNLVQLLIYVGFPCINYQYHISSGHVSLNSDSGIIFKINVCNNLSNCCAKNGINQWLESRVCTSVDSEELQRYLVLVVNPLSTRSWATLTNHWTRTWPHWYAVVVIQVKQTVWVQILDKGGDHPPPPPTLFSADSDF